MPQFFFYMISVNTVVIITDHTVSCNCNQGFLRFIEYAPRSISIGFDILFDIEYGPLVYIFPMEFSPFSIMKYGPCHTIWTHTAPL